MPINLLGLEELLQKGVGKYYDSLSKAIPDYKAEFKKILKARKEEFKHAPKFLWITHFPYNENNYTYSIFNKLAAKQIYRLDKEDIGVRTEEFSLPVTDLTEIEKVEIYSSARIPCGCWKGVRKKIAEDNDLMVGDNEFYANVDSLLKVAGRIAYVKDAKERLDAGIQKDFNSRLELTKI